MQYTKNGKLLPEKLSIEPAELHNRANAIGCPANARQVIVHEVNASGKFPTRQLQVLLVNPAAFNDKRSPKSSFIELSTVCKFRSDYGNDSGHAAKCRNAAEQIRQNWKNTLQEQGLIGNACK